MRGVQYKTMNFFPSMDLTPEERQEFVTLTYRQNDVRIALMNFQAQLQACQDLDQVDNMHMHFHDFLVTLFSDTEDVDDIIPQFETLLTLCGRLKDTRKKILELQLMAQSN